MVQLNREFIDEINGKYRAICTSFSKDEMAYNLDRLTFRQKLIGFMTPEYYRRKQLFIKGEIIYGFIYRTYQTNNESDPIQLWVITSPIREFADNPQLLADISEKLAEIDLTKRSIDKKVSQFINRIYEPFADVRYLEIPGEFTNGRLAFLSTTFYLPNHLHQFKLGINLFLSNPKVTKEILMLPDRYWPDQYLENYYLNSIS